jgi:hypothetical protein
MTPRKLKVGLAYFCYGGNGGTSSVCPDLAEWLWRFQSEVRGDPRIERVVLTKFADTPITATRNAACLWAQENGIDVLLMLDNDNAPDLLRGSVPEAKPFFQSSFDFIYAHYDKGPVLVAAPYCGLPWHPVKGGEENVYVFRWQRGNSGHLREVGYSLEQFSRTEASILSGISEVGAIPTGVCMFDTRCLQLLAHPYFEYEWDGDGCKCASCGQPKPGPRAKKASTEDVTFSRNLSLNGITRLGYNPVHCNWDAWAGHWKPWCVGRPEQILASDIHQQFMEAARLNHREGERLFLLKPEDDCRPVRIEVPRAAEQARINKVQELIDSVNHAQQGKAAIAGGEGETCEGACGGPQATTAA